LNSGYRQDIKNKTASTLWVFGYNMVENAVTNTNKKDGIFQFSIDKKIYAVITLATINNGCSGVFQYCDNDFNSPSTDNNINGYITEISITIILIQ
jgi:hypothetical protein